MNVLYWLFCQYTLKGSVFTSMRSKNLWSGALPGWKLYCQDSTNPLSSKCFPISIMIFLTCELIGRVEIRGFTSCLLVIDSNLTPYWSEKCGCYDTNLQTLQRDLLYDLLCSFFVDFSHVLVYIYSMVIKCNVLFVYINSSLVIVLFRSSSSLKIFLSS